MLRIRLRRSGKKNNPNYRLVVAEHSAPIGGKFIELLGSYNPHTKALTLKEERILAWLNQGALPSNTAAKLLKKSTVKHGNIVVTTRAKRASKSENSEPKPEKSEAKPATDEVKPAEDANSAEETNEDNQSGEKAE
jgi:small subunit ribosomal protein S16